MKNERYNFNKELQTTLKLRMGVLGLLKSLFTSNMYNDPKSYEDVDNFYAKIGYNFESEKLINQIGIYCTSELQTAFITNKTPIQYNSFIEKNNIVHLISLAYDNYKNYSLYGELVPKIPNEFYQKFKHNFHAKQLLNELFNINNGIDLQNVLIQYNKYLDSY